MLLFLLAGGSFFTGCSNTKYLPEGEHLYTGAKVKIDNADGEVSKKRKKQLRNELEDITKPKPNSTFLGFLRPKLWVYNIVGKPKREKGLRMFIRNKLGEPPVLFSKVEPEKNRELLRNRLENRGHFQAQVTFEIKEDGKHKRKMIYTASIRRPYTINRVIWPQEDDTISKHIRNSQEATLLKTGTDYNLDILKDERGRIDEKLKNEGFFYFSGDYILFRVDSTVGDKKLDVFVTVKKDLPEKAFRIYTLNEIYVYTNYSLGRDSSRARKMETVHVEDITFIRRNNRIRPKALARSIFLHRGDHYTNSNYKLTLNRLMSMGIFKFVNVRFTEVDSSDNNNKLNASVYLTQMPRRSIRLELRGVSKSNSFVGPEFTGTLRNRNLLRGAELFTTTINAGYETLIGGEQSGINSYTLGAEAKLELPRFVVPFRVKNQRSQEVPRTVFRAGTELISRVNYFNMASLNFGFGYAWMETPRKKHEFYPVVINYLAVTRESDLFKQLRNDNLFLDRSFQNQFILGLTYSFTYDTHVEGDNKHDFYFNGTADLSGNTFYLAEKLFTGNEPTVQEPFKFLGAPYSQYSRFSLDFRHYLNLDKRSQIVSRILTGVGVPYGNSTILPYTKQFFIGGNSSVRAFQVRSLGPGTYRPEERNRRNFLVDQAGDLKLEGNLEYRFPIYGVFKGAVFTDAGNIWIIREDTDKPGGTFNTSTFTNELAVGTGAGLRIDASFFVLRFDLAFPLRKPFLPENERWVADDIHFGKPEWRQENLVLNIAIGYPF
ncbi:MAG: translocation and assembly module lipoprotein TamL [Bacteroidia bacterium]